MPRYTDWFTAPTRTIVHDPDGVLGSDFLEFTLISTMSPVETDFDAARNSPTAGGAGVGVAATAVTGGYYVSQDKLAVRWTALHDMFDLYVDWSAAPAGTRQVQYEFGGDGFPADSVWLRWPFTVDWITAISAAVTYTFDPFVNHVNERFVDAFVHSNAFTFAGDGSPPAETNGWYVGDSFLGTLAHPTPFVAGPRDTINFPVGTSSGTLHVPLASADIGVNPAVDDRDAWSLIVATTEDAYSGEIPSSGSPPSGLQVATSGLGVVSITYRPPRFRFVTDVPLRQYPRDDALGGAPREGNVNGPTSVQGSARQGWANTYR